MANFEKYKDDIQSVNFNIAKVEGEIVECRRLCNDCDFFPDDDVNTCTKNIIKWLYEELKEPAPRLTKAERAFCETEGNGWIARDKIISSENYYQSLYIYEEFPMRKGGYWVVSGYYKPVFHKINQEFFPFITWESEPWSISELLELEVEK